MYLKHCLVMSACGKGRQGQEKEKETTYEQMQGQCVEGNKQRFLRLLEGCSSVADLEEGRRVHADIVRERWESDVCIGNSLISMYSKCGSVLDARNVFDTMSRRSVVSWNAMISGYTGQKQEEEALKLYAEMQNLGVSPNDRTFVGVLKACSRLASREATTVVDGRALKVEALQKVKGIQGKAVRRGFQTNVFVGSSLIHMFASCGSIGDARLVFDTLADPNMVSWNAMLGGYVEQEEGEKALELYVVMQERGVRPNDRTFVSVIKACGSVAAREASIILDGQAVKVESLRVGKAIHAEVLLSGHESDSFVGSTLIKMYSSCGSIVDARDVFNSLPHVDVVSWNSMIAGYAQQELAEEALQLYFRMQAEGMRPTEATFLCILRVCSSLGALNTCNRIHHDVIAHGFEQSIPVTSALIHAYGKCGSMVDARQVFDRSRKPDLVLWNALIGGYAREGDCEMVFQCFAAMVEAGIQPDGVTFLSLLSACSHAGMVSKGLGYFESMTREHALPPSNEHYACVVDLLGRAGLFDMVKEFMMQVPLEPGLSVWMSLLGACRKYGKVELGRHAFDCLIQIDPGQSAAYVLLSHIYAQAGMLRSAKEIDELRRQAGARKQPGQTWINHNQEVHMFMVEDNRHKEILEIYEVLQELDSFLGVPA